MRKNVASQIIAAEMVATADGTAVTSGAVTVYTTIDGGAQDAGVAATHEGNGCYTYAPTQALTNGDHIAYTFTHASGVPVTVNVYPVSFDYTAAADLGVTSLVGHTPQTGDSFARIGVNGAGLSNIDLPNQTMDITGDLSGSVGSVTGAVGSVTAINTTGGAVDTVTTVTTTTTNTDMRGTDSAALASVLGALNDAAVGGDPTATDTIMQYIKQLVNVLVGTAGVVTFPAAGAPANAISLAEIIRAIYDDTNELQGDWVDAGRLDAILDARMAEASINTTGGAVDTVTTLTGHTVQTGDSYARLGAPAGASVSADVADVKTGTLTAAAKAILDATTLGVVNTTVNDASATTTAFVITSTEATDSHFNGRVIIFTAGTLINQATDITAYTGATKTVTVTALTSAPANGDSFVIV